LAGRVTVAYVEPTIFANPDNKAVSVSTDEIFGPVITAMPYEDIDTRNNFEF